jgi:hypothetical protein
MEEIKDSEDYEQDSIKDVNFVRSVAQKATAVPGTQMNIKYEILPLEQNLKVNEIMKIEDVQILSHCYLVQYLIFGKFLLTFILLIGVGVLLFTFWMPLLFFEFFGFFGTTKICRKLNLGYLVVLWTSLALRVGSIGLSLMLFDFNRLCFDQDFYSFQNNCELYGKYVVCSLILTGFEIVQIWVMTTLFRKLKRIDEQKRIELSFVLISQKVPRFICRGKLRPWKVIQ